MRRPVELRGRRGAGRAALGRDLDQLDERRIAAAQRRSSIQRAGVVAGRELADDVDPTREGLGEGIAARDGAGALALAGHHQGIDHGGGDRGVGIAACAAHHLVQALGLAHRGEPLDLAGEQAGRRAAVGGGRGELAHQHLELQIAQRAAARRGRQRRHQPLGRAERRAAPRIGRHAAGAHGQEAGRAVVEIGGLRRGRRRQAQAEDGGERQDGGEASARSVHWTPGPRNAAAAAAAR